MDEREALALVAEQVAPAGDDAAVVGDLLVTTDMLHERTDFPPGTTRYTAGWRSVGASLSDVAAMGGEPLAAVAVYAAPRFEAEALAAFLEGAVAVCEAAGCEYVGGDLDSHEEFTVAATAVGRATDPVLRSGATPGDHVVVTGSLGRTAAALECFAADERERGNELFQFQPRIEEGRALGAVATAMMDSSDGLARSAHQLADASGVAVALESDAIPVAAALETVIGDPGRRFDLAISLGEDFELVATVSPDTLGDLPVAVSSIGRVESGSGVTLDGEPLADEGYTHG